MIYTPSYIKISNKKNNHSKNYDWITKCNNCNGELDIEDLLFVGVCIYCNTLIDCKGVHYF